jgi:hypothetical protein
MFSRRDKFMLFLLQLNDTKSFDADLTTQIYKAKKMLVRNERTSI